MNSVCMFALIKYSHYLFIDHLVYEESSANKYYKRSRVLLLWAEALKPQHSTLLVRVTRSRSHHGLCCCFEICVNSVGWGKFASRTSQTRLCSVEEPLQRQSFWLVNGFTRVVVSRIFRCDFRQFAALHHLDHRLFSHELVQRLRFHDERQIGFAITPSAHGALQQPLKRNKVHSATQVVASFG